MAAASEARMDTCKECWNVPGQVSLSFFKIGLLMLDSYTSVMLDTYPNVFSNIYTNT